MSVDLTQFHQVFIEESIEGLDIMESTLMELDTDNIDGEMINTIFRSAHSIKGGSATFGFTAIAEFTHVLETLLDQIRSGARAMSSSDVNLFLKSVDCMREFLGSIDNGISKATDESLSLQHQFEGLLKSDDTEKTIDTDRHANDDNAGLGTSEEGPDSESENTWRIHFVPGSDILKTGNDPARIFLSLRDMGEFTVEIIARKMPEFSDFDPERLYLGWDITLTTVHSKEEVLEQFEWVADESTLDVSKVEKEKVWRIRFSPKPSLLKSGNEPVKIIEALSDIGRVSSVVVDTSSVPKIKSLDSEECHLSWDILLEGRATKEEVEEVFEWVEDEAEVTINPFYAPVVEGKVEPLVEAAPVAESVVQPSLGTTSESTVSVTNKDSVAQAKAMKKSSNTESTSIRVGIDKVDTLINMVGELVITQSMLGQLGTDFDPSQVTKLIEGLSQLEQNTRELQESVMRIRMLPISFAFSRFPRMVRDLGQQLNKSIHLEMIGDQTELDKTVMEKIGDPLVHLVRNAIDHGIETPQERKAAGKSETGHITLNAYHLSGNVVIEIQDDGKGLDRDRIIEKAIEKELLTQADSKQLTDEQVYDLIFQPGFSTAAVVSDVSGRGVGMDVVRRNIQALNGIVEIQSQKGKGSKILIRLPLTLAILDGQLVNVSGEVFVFPLVSIVESIQCKKEMVNHIAGGCKVFKLRNEYIPILRLDETYSSSSLLTSQDPDNSLMVVVENEREKYGIVVDELLAQQQVVIKSLEQNYKRVEGVSGATILGDGRVALIVDIPGVIRLAGVKGVAQQLNENLKQEKMLKDNMPYAQSNVDGPRLQA